MAVHHLTGSAQVVNMLYRFGHCLSMSQVQELDTSLAERQLQQQAIDTFLPSNINRTGSTVSFCWDNYDLQEETVTGRGTTYCTNGIVIQRVTFVPSLPPAVLEPQRKRTRHQRALSDTLPMELPDYYAGLRCGPPAS